MGYTTDFIGEFKLNKKLDEKTQKFLELLATTRRMKRDVSKLPESGYEKLGFDSWGVQGEFFAKDDGDCGQGDHESIVEYNNPPTTQPDLWCQWIPTEDGLAIEWDGNEKFYNYVEWLDYIVSNVLKPRGYKLDGQVDWAGEQQGDVGIIMVTDNVIKILAGRTVYEEI